MKLQLGDWQITEGGGVDVGPKEASQPISTSIKCCSVDILRVVVDSDITSSGDSLLMFLFIVKRQMI